MKDMVERGRQGPPPAPKRGEEHGMHKLTRAQVDAIRVHPGPRKAIREAFGISKSQVQRILTGGSWLLT